MHVDIYIYIYICVWVCLWHIAIVVSGPAGRASLDLCTQLDETYSIHAHSSAQANFYEAL